MRFYEHAADITPAYRAMLENENGALYEDISRGKDRSK
jgi:hypothetical protein